MNPYNKFQRYRFFFGEIVEAVAKLRKKLAQYDHIEEAKINIFDADAVARVQPVADDLNRKTRLLASQVLTEIPNINAVLATATTKVKYYNRSLKTIATQVEAIIELAKTSEPIIERIAGLLQSILDSDPQQCQKKLASLHEKMAEILTDDISEESIPAYCIAAIMLDMLTDSSAFQNLFTSATPESEQATVKQKIIEIQRKIFEKLAEYHKQAVADMRAEEATHYDNELKKTDGSQPKAYTFSNDIETYWKNLQAIRNMLLLEEHRLPNVVILSKGTLDAINENMVPVLQQQQEFETQLARNFARRASQSTDSLSIIFKEYLEAEITKADTNEKKQALVVRGGNHLSDITTAPLNGKLADNIIKIVLIALAIRIYERYKKKCETTLGSQRF